LHVTTTHALIAFTLAAGLLTITPGLDTALVLRTAAVEGTRRAMLAGAGICAGLLAWALAVSIGLGALLTASHLIYNLLRWAGAGYLIYLGVKLFLGKIQPDATSDQDTPASDRAGQGGGHSPRWFARGFLSNILNPKVGVFYVTFLPQFIPSGAPVTAFGMVLGSIHVIEGALWFALLISATATLSRWLRRPRAARAIDRTTGTLFIGLGTALVFEKGR
jgi:threonine/homoserine/homoserine lactone efflux protein